MYCYSKTKRAISIISLVFTVVIATVAQNSVSSGQLAGAISILDSSKEQDGLAGSVRRVKTESAKLHVKSGRLEEGPLQLLETTTYGLDGSRIENLSFPIVSTPVGKEEYRYDDKGNIVEMTLRANDGSILSREAYEYEFDRFGNWKKMVTSLVVFEGGELKREPVEITYRTLTYYFDDAVAGVLASGPKTAPAVALPAVKTNVVQTSEASLLPAMTSTPDAPSSSIKLSSEPPPNYPAYRAPESSVKKEEQQVSAPNAAASPSSLNSGNDMSKESARPKYSAGSSALVASPAAVPARVKANELYLDGSVRMDSGDLSGAVAAFLESLELEPSADVNLGLGYAYLKLDKGREAIKAFKQATILNPKLAEAHYGLGYEYYDQRRTRDAVVAFKRAIELNPKMAKAHYGLALAYQDLKDHDGLNREYRTLQNLDREMAKKLEATFPVFNLPCRLFPFCK